MSGERFWGILGSLWRFLGGDFVTPLSQVFGEVEEGDEMAHGKPWEHCYVQRVMALMSFTFLLHGNKLVCV